MEPRILLVGKIGPIMDILGAELNANYGRDIISSSSKTHVEEVLASTDIDLVILGAGFDDETRDDVAARVAELKPDIEVYLVPRIGEKSPLKLIEITNEKALEWKFAKAMGVRPGGRMGPPA